MKDCLCEVSETIGEWVKVEAASNSTAVDVVVPNYFMPHLTVRRSKRSSEGRHYAEATDTTIMNDRVNILEFFTDGSRGS